MDTLRGNFDSGEPVDDTHDWDDHEEESVHELPPEAIGQDERRMQVRAYNHWAGLLGDRTFPSIEDLDPANLPDFGPNSVLLDFSAGIEDPIVVYLGDLLGEECGMGEGIERLSDVPSRSLLSRITDHYLQILANQAPIGFEAEFVNQRGASIMYRGILLPYSSDDETIDFIYGVINWKEMADQVTADELLLEIDQAIADGADENEIFDEEEDEPHKHHADPVTDWADSPAVDLVGDSEAAMPMANNVSDPASDNVETFESVSDYETPADDGIPTPDFGHYGLDGYDEGEEEDYEEGEEDDSPGYSFASLTDHVQAPAKKAIDLEAVEFNPDDYKVDYGDDFGEHEVSYGDEELDNASDDYVEEEEYAEDDDYADEHGFDEEEFVGEEVSELVVEHAVESPVESVEAPVKPVVATPEPAIELSAQIDPDAGLYDTLASARELAETARTSEDRSRHALYAAVGRAYDFSLVAKENPQEFNELLEDSGLSIQDRAPMTPVVKLVFGADYDKTRLTEYAAVLSHAHRLGLECGTLDAFLEDAEGGLKGVVGAERRLRKEEAGHEVEPEKEVRRALAKKLRALEALTLEALAKDGPEFGLVMIRRNAEGVVELIGEIDEDVPMIERAARKLVG
jgi:hypothetical protein